MHDLRISRVGDVISANGLGNDGCESTWASCDDDGGGANRCAEAVNGVAFSWPKEMFDELCILTGRVVDEVEQSLYPFDMIPPSSVGRVQYPLNRNRGICRA